MCATHRYIEQLEEGVGVRQHYILLNTLAEVEKRRNRVGVTPGLSDGGRSLESEQRRSIEGAV